MNPRHLKEDYVGELPISVVRYSDTERVSPHTHEFIEMVYLTSGTAQHHCCLGTTRLKAGDYLIIDSDNVHAFSEKSEDFAVVFCEFTPSFVDETLGAYARFSDVLKNFLVNLQPSEETGVYHFFDEDNTVKLRLENMLTEYQNRDRGFLELLRCQLLEILIVSMRRRETRSQHIDDKTKAVLSYLAEHYAEDVTLSSLAEKQYCTVANLSLLFKKNCGMTFTRYLHKLRMTAACRLLRETDLSIDAVAEQVGYRDTRHFRILFKQTTGKTPLKFRKYALSGSANSF